MKTKKIKYTKVGTGNQRRKIQSDVPPSTSLPPLVEGQLRCFLRVTVSKVLWTVPKPPPTTFVRLRWWGESSSGTHFRPQDGSQKSQKIVKSTARFPIRCGPKQFTSYLTDMGSLMLEVLTNPEHLPIARTQVAGISQLSFSHSISGFFTLVSPTSEKLGELQVSLALQALAETYHSSSSVPTTDMSFETAVSEVRSTVKPASPQISLVVPSRSRPLSANSGKESGSNTPRGKDHLYFRNVQTEKKTDVAVEFQRPTSSRSQHGQESTCGQASNDILSVILERGSKLRNAMVVSALKSGMDCEFALKDTSLPLPKDNIGAPPMSSILPSGKLLQNLLHAESSLLLSPQSPTENLSRDCDTANRAVDLLLGSFNGSTLPIWDGDGSPPDSLLSVCGDSELNDPQYDQSLLENLFYKTPISNGDPGDEDVGGPYLKMDLNMCGDKEELRLSGPKKTTGGDSDLMTPGTGDVVPGLSMEQLNVLADVRLARVVVHSLTVPTDSSTITPRKTSGKGKPPRPLSTKKCSYFVEYLFPASSSRHGPSQAMAAEVTRVVSTKVTGGVVTFQQSSMFPVHFSGSTIEQWWGTDLTFNIYSKKSFQKKPLAIGKAVFPVRCLLQREPLSQTLLLPVLSQEVTCESQNIGSLKVSVELAADNKDFSSTKNSKSAPGSTAPFSATATSLTANSPSRGEVNTARPHPKDPRGEDLHSSAAPNSNSWRDIRTVVAQGPSPLTCVQTSLPRRQIHLFEEEECEVLLHALLMVPDGKDFDCGPMQPPNIYLNCKLFGQDEMSRSVISWGQRNPTFNFVQVAPLALTSRLLDRMRNNVMVIEVWQRAGISGKDRLLGLVKVPLHQFYMSFRDPKISQLLLQAQYPVLGVDSYMPVTDVFSGIIKGNLHVLLAMGQSEQIVALQRIRDEELGSVPRLPRPGHLLDLHPNKEHKVKPSSREAMIEHLFVVKVEKVKGLTPLQSTVWGEADCYVQYAFPTQEEPPDQSLDPNLIESSLNLRQFRTTTSLCVPDPVFNHSESHVLLAPAGVPVQRLLLSSFSGQGMANGGGVQFEVWCRYYYPNVRDQLVAKGVLPLSKLCAMVTMQRQQPAEAQVFSLPLTPRTDSPAGHQPQPSGLLDVYVHYKHGPLRCVGRSGAVASRVATVVIQVHRAAGLQAAARALSEQDDTFQYYADVGVNAFVTARLSFLPESESRSTRVVARTFCPEFDHHTEFPCELQIQRAPGETCSLAELLQEATAVFTVRHRDSPKAMARSTDTLLGTVTIQLADLVYRRTGIRGWFGVSLPQDLASPSSRHHILVGGLDISITFAHHADRERVIAAARDLGWEAGRADGPEKPAEDEETGVSDGEDWALIRRTVSLTLSTPRAWLPVRCLLLPGHSELQRSTYCYLRYKVYDQEAFCSQLRHPGLSMEVKGGGEEGLATVSFIGSRTVELRSSQPLYWYLQEERLEVQVWVAFGKDRRVRPLDSDRLVGSAFVDLSSLAKRAQSKLTLTGVYPLFRRSAPDLSGAALRVHITLTPGSLPKDPTIPGADSQVLEDCDSQGEEQSRGQEGPSSTAALSGAPEPRDRPQTDPSASAEPSEVSVQDAFSVTITVERAMHLSLKGCPLVERSGGLPSCCVSYATADSTEPVTTAVIADSPCPVWGHQQECRLSKKLLLDPQRSLVFKIWHKGDVERVIGFASVDLSPLLSGFQSVCGWYNITDFSGQCQGQLKVSVCPLKGVQELRGQRQAACEDANKDSSTLFQTIPLYYRTTATYSSFPSHISRYTEQRINSSPATPDHLDRLLSESQSDRHDEHMDKVRLYHQGLQEGGAGRPNSAAAGVAHPSSSVLFSALRKNLSELDEIQRYFSRKLSTPNFPSVSEPGQRSRLEEHGDTDSSQLLLKSSRLVGEVNDLVSDLHGHHRVETTSFSPQISSTTSPVSDEHLLPGLSGTFPQSAPGSQKVSTSLLEEVSPVPSPEPSLSQEPSGSQTEEEADAKTPASEDEGPREEEEDGDYEETVVEPRPLNEVTSLTDRTSPWTSLLSDPELGSLESLEAPEEHPASDSTCIPSLTQQEGEGERPGLQTDALLAWSSGEPIDCRPEVRDQHANSGGFSHESEEDEADTVRNQRKMRQTPLHSSDDEAVQRQESNTASLHDESPLCSGEIASRVPGDRDTLSEGETPGLLHDTAATKPSDPVEIPNFFLPSHHLEASMRALRIAPVFSRASSDPKESSHRHGIPYHRLPLPRPNISSLSMKKEETKRIAKIFASHFKDEH